MWHLPFWPRLCPCERCGDRVSATTYLLAATPLRLAMNGSTVALPVLTVSTMNDVALGGLLVAAALGPSVMAAPIVGALLDRTKRPRTMVAGAGLVVALGLVGATFLGTVPTAFVTLGLLAAGVAAPFFQGGMSSFVAEEITGERRAYALDALSYNISTVGGPSIVAAASALHSARLALATLALSALIGVAGTVLTRLRPRTKPNRSIPRTIAAGLHHITTHRPLMLVITSGAITQLGQGALPITVVLLALERAGNASDGALVMSIFAIGGLLGAVTTAVRPAGQTRPETTMMFGFVAIGLLTIGAAIDLGMLWTMIVLCVAGMFTAPSLAAMLMLRKQQSPLALRGQVFTVAAGVRATASAGGAALAGLAAGLGGGALIICCGLVWIAASVMLLGYPRGVPPLDY